MADTRRLSGVAWLFIDGVQYTVVSGAGYGVATEKRETLASMSGIDGYKSTFVPGFIKATIRDTADMSVADFMDMTDVSVTLRLASGKQISGTGMWTVEAAEVDSTEATFDVRFDGEDVTEN